MFSQGNRSPGQLSALTHVYHASNTISPSLSQDQSHIALKRLKRTTESATIPLKWQRRGNPPLRPRRPPPGWTRLRPTTLDRHPHPVRDTPAAASHPPDNEVAPQIQIQHPSTVTAAAATTSPITGAVISTARMDGRSETLSITLSCFSLPFTPLTSRSPAHNRPHARPRSYSERYPSIFSLVRTRSLTQTAAATTTPRTGAATSRPVMGAAISGRMTGAAISGRTTGAVNWDADDDAGCCNWGRGLRGACNC